MSKIPPALYLHGGPGLNCAVERAWFGDTYPILWWDQPRFPADAENAYQATLDAAAEKLAALMTEDYLEARAKRASRRQKGAIGNDTYANILVNFIIIVF